MSKDVTARSVFERRGVRVTIEQWDDGVVTWTAERKREIRDRRPFSADCKHMIFGGGKYWCLEPLASGSANDLAEARAQIEFVDDEELRRVCMAGDLDCDDPGATKPWHVYVKRPR